MNNETTQSSQDNPTEKQVLRKQANWEGLYFYQKANVLYQMTFAFTKRFLTRGDRTIDQMVQADSGTGKDIESEGGVVLGGLVRSF